jgi:predicted MPP superfamily phosphohydrolase
LSSFTRRKFFKLGAALAASGALVTAADAALFEPDYPKLVEIEIPLARLSPAFDGFRIAQLSDFHYTEHFSAIPIRKAVAMVNALKVDVIVLTGDFVTVPLNANHRTAKAGADAIDPCAHVLSPLRARLGTFACMGNHDTGSDPRRVSRTLEQNGIPVLINRAVAFEQNNSRLWLAGIGDAMEGRDDLPAAIQGIPSGEPVILLAHEPDLALQIAKSPVDLQLSGHSHGGQVRLPWIGALVLPELAEIYPWGLNRVGNLMLYTNVGIGTIRVPVRFNCPAEVTLITLRSVPTTRG